MIIFLVEKAKRQDTDHTSSDAAAGRHCQDVEDGRTDNGADSDVAFSDECADDVDKEFWRGRGRRHKGSPRYVVWHVQGWNNELHS